MRHFTLTKDIRFATLDSRRAGPGGVFLASAGVTPQSRDGHDYIAQAMEQGASAIVVEHLPATLATHQVPVFMTENSRLLAAQLSEELVGFPSRKLKISAITGTNGKTTTSFLATQIFQAAHLRSAVVGTLGFGAIDSLKPFGFTTPEAEILSPMLSELAKQEFTHVVMEVSSHALATYRADGLHFAAAAFTNLSQDHLDFHRDLEDYRRAKDRLFLELLPPQSPAILPLNHHLLPVLRERQHPVMTWGCLPSADLHADDIQSSAHGMAFDLAYAGHRYPIQTRLIGEFNVDNILCAVGLSLANGIPIAEIVPALSTCYAPPGRLQPVETPNAKTKPVVIVDFAHTPDALQKVLETLRPIARSKLIVVMGCGGDRDKSKRPQMGLIARTLSDYMIATSDNPRHEDPLTIIHDIAAGVPIVDRRDAIAHAIHMATADDVVLIAGKGHETTQQIGDDFFPFDDASVAKQFLEDWRP